MTRRKDDWIRIAITGAACVVAAIWPATWVFAQSQDFINGSVTQQIAGLTLRIDKIDSMINAVLLALVMNFIAQIVNIRSARNRRGSE